MKVALKQLQNGFDVKAGLLEGRVLTILQLCHSGNQLSQHVRNALVPRMSWMVTVLTHEYFKEVELSLVTY